MINEAVHKAVEAVCSEDGMSQIYKNALAALIENAMLDNLDLSDIESLLDLVEVKDATDED